MRTLLSKTIMRFIVCMLVVFVLTTPLFYLITERFYAEDMIDIIESVKQGNGIPPLDLEQDIMAGMMIQFLLVFLAVSLSFFITVRFAMRSLWYPFDDTLKKAEKFNVVQGDIPKFLPTDVYEFDRLNRSLTILMEKDSKTFRIQKEFSENASHELQTPLAVMRSKLDLLMQEDMGERQMRLVSDLYQLTMRMSHLNRNLLMLAKIDNVQYDVQEEVDIVFMLNTSLPMYSVLRQNNDIEVRDRRTDHGKKLRANSVLLDCLLKNLVVNGIRHSAPDGKISILLEDNKLTVSNPSIDNKALDASKLFCRFSGGAMRSTGNGLGLAIVKAICDYHGWTVGYGFVDGEHRFIVKF